MFNKSKG